MNIVLDSSTKLYHDNLEKKKKVIIFYFEPSNIDKSCIFILLVSELQLWVRQVFLVIEGYFSFQNKFCIQ